MMTKRYKLVNKYNPNELILDTACIIDGVPQIYDAECIEDELNSQNTRIQQLEKALKQCGKILLPNGRLTDIQEEKECVNNDCKDR